MMNGEWLEFTPTTEIKAGMLLRVYDQTVLVGNVNELLGVCDDCKDFERSAITHYRIVWAGA